VITATASEGNNEDNYGNDDDADDDDDDDEDDYDNNEDYTSADDDEDHIPKINIPNTVVSTPPATPDQSTGVGVKSAGVGEGGRNMHTQNTGVASNDVPEGPDTDDENNQMARTMDDRYGARQHGINLRDCKPRNCNHLYDSNHLLATFEEPMGELFITEQMSLKK
jgi:hypothetical protein